MKEYIKYILFASIALLIASIIFLMHNLPRLYSKNYFYMNTYINIKLYAPNKKEANNVLNKADKIFKKYQKISDAYNDKSDISYINNNTSNEEELVIDEDLYKMIDMSLSWYAKSNHKFNINIGSLIKVWKKYRDSKTGIPTSEELNDSMKNINDIVLLGNNKIKNNHPNIDLGGVAKGYASQKIADMLKENKIDNFIINAGGNVVVGTPTDKNYYKIGIESPIENSEIYQVVRGSNISVVTSGGYQRFYEYNGIKYHHIIDPDTMYPASNMLSVSVIAPDSALADILSTTLFLLPPKEGLKLVNNLDNVEAIFYIDKDNIIKSKGFNKYE